MKNSLKILFLIFVVFLLNGCITPDDPSPEEETVVYKNLTMSNDCVNTSEVQTLLALRGWDYNYARTNIDSNYKLAYKNSNNDTILVSVIVDTTFAHSVIEIKYNDDLYRIASSNVKSANEDYGLSSYGYYDFANVWTKLDGTITYDSYYTGNITTDHYKRVYIFPIFSGEWTIDNDNSTDLGKEYLSNILFETTDEGNIITKNKVKNNVSLNPDLNITNIIYKNRFDSRTLSGYGDGIYFYNGKIVYNNTNSNEKLEIQIHDTSSGYYTNLFVVHKKNDTILEEYIFSNDREALSINNCYTAYVTVGNKWAKKSEDTQYCEYFDFNAPVYYELSNLPVFYGTWVLDESTVNDDNLGLLNLNVLISNE